MPLFMRDIRNRHWRYTSNRDGWYSKKGWVDLYGDFQNATRETMDEGLNFFYARDFVDIKPYIAARKMINDILEVYLDQGVITPSGDYYGVRPNKHQDFVDALLMMKEHLPDTLERQVHCYGIGTPWLNVRHDFGTSIPSDSSKAQIHALERIGYKNGDQIHYNGKFYRDAFPDGDNQAMNDLIHACFDLMDEADLYMKENKALNCTLRLVCIENDFSL